MEALAKFLWSVSLRLGYKRTEEVESSSPSPRIYGQTSWNLRDRQKPVELSHTHRAEQRYAGGLVPRKEGEEGTEEEDSR